MKNIANYQIKGIATLLIRDKDTLEIKDVVTEENFVTDYFDHTINGDNLYLFISEADNKLTPRSKGVGKTYFGSDISGVNRLTKYLYPSVATPYIELHQRFAAPTSTNRTIRYVGTCLYTNTPYITPYTVLELTTPVVQTTSDIIDLIYRLEVIRATIFDIDGVVTGNTGYQSNYLVNDYSSNTSAQLLPSTYVGSFVAFGIGYDFESYRPNFQLTNQTYNPWYEVLQRPVFGNGSNNIINLNKISESKVETHSFNLNIGSIDQGFMLEKVVNPIDSFPVWFNTSRDPNYVKSTFVHSSVTTVPFYDSVNVPSSTGKVISTEGPGSFSEYIPRYHRFKITTSGGVGTATYQYEYCLFHRFLGNEFDLGTVALDHINTGSFDTFLSGRNYATEPTCVMPVRQPGVEEDDDYVDLLFVFNDTIIIVPIYSLKTPRIIDSTTGLNATEITQVYAKDVSNIWIACVNTGLYYYNGATVTQIDPTTFGLNNPCYGVTGGPGGSVWAMFDGGLAVTTDNGVTWTTYTSTTTPSLNLNIVSFADVVSITGDLDHPDNRLAILYKDQTTNDYRIQWWDSINGSQNVTGFTVGENSTLDIISNRRVFTQRIGVRQGVWASAYINNGGTTYQGILNFNSTSPVLPTTSLGTNDTSPKTLQPLLVKTDTGVNLLAYTSSTLSRTLLDPLGSEQNIPASTQDISVINSVDVYKIVYLKNGRLIFFANSNNAIVQNYLGFLTAVSTHTGDPTFGPLTKEYWKSFGWDGTQWVRDNTGSKVTHASAELVPGNINVSFDDQGGTLTFTAGEEYATTTAYGVVHDGTVDTTVSFELMQRRATKINGVGETIPSTPVTITTNFDPRGLQFTDVQGTISFTDEYLTNTPSKRMYITGSYNASCRTQQTFDGDFYIELSIIQSINNTQDILFGISSGQTGNPVSTATIEHGIDLTNSEIKIYENGGTLVSQQPLDPTIIDINAAASTRPYTLGIKRTGGTIEYYLNNVLIYTSTLSSVGAKNLEFLTQASYLINNSFYFTKIENVQLTDHYISVNLTPPVSDIRMIVSDETSIDINGIAPTTILVNDYDTPLAAGEVSILESSGLIRFSPSDAGKTVNYTTLLVYNII